VEFSNKEADMTRSIFRGLVIGYLILLVASVVTEFATESWLPEPLQAYLQTEEENELTAKEIIIVLVGLSMLLAEVVAVVGLCFFHNWSRWLFLGATVVWVLLTSYAGPYVLSGMAEAMNCLTVLLNGAILAIAWGAPIADMFERKGG
jgi:hypothetical protein